MPRFTGAYSNLMNRLLEVATIQQMGQQAAKLPFTHQNRGKINSLYRSGVVLLSSHIEGYIEELGELALDKIYLKNVPKVNLGAKFKFHLSKDLIDEIKKAEDPEKVAAKIQHLLNRDGHIWNAQPTYTSQLSTQIFIGDFSNPTHEKITKFFHRFGFNEYEGNLASRLTVNYQICVNMINHVVNQRNLIAHGDINATGTHNDLLSMMELVKLYCRETDYVVGNWFRSVGCCIR